MKITHIAHCGFLIETENEYLLFDYYKGEIPKMSEDKPLYVFASHFHKDHYNPKIFKYENASFILSSEITDFPKELNVISVSADNTYNLSDSLSVKTFDSTDCGVAFLVFSNGKTVYHGGDLNLWLWDTDTDTEKEKMESKFKSETEKIKSYKIDLAFLHLDPRQEEYASLGLLYFNEKVNPQKIFPMHFWGKYKYTKREIEEGSLSKIKEKIFIPDKDNNIFYL